MKKLSFLLLLIVAALSVSAQTRLLWRQLPKGNPGQVAMVDSTGNGKWVDSYETFIVKRLAVGYDYIEISPPSGGAIFEGSVGIGTISPVAPLDVNGKIRAVLPVYDNDAAADADVSLHSGEFYKITGSRIVYQKP